MVSSGNLLLMVEQAGRPYRMLLGIGALLLVALLLYLARAGGEGSDPVEAYPYPLPTFLPLPSTPPAGSGIISSGMALPENWLHLYPYDPEAYPQFAEAMPVGTECATWENGGLFWVNNEGLEEVELPPWSVVVEQPRFRFCGFSEPYPPKPE